MSSIHVKVDTKLAEIHARYWTLRNKRAQIFAQADRVRKYDPEMADRIADQAGAMYFDVARLEAEMAPFERLYDKFRWNRAFVVPEGHVHSSMSCSTCYPTTQFGWVTEYSGKTEAEIIEAAGSRACTICYPNAPVDAPPGRIFHATELAAETARQERAAKKAAADAKKAANAIGPYRTQSRDRIETVHQAKAYLTDGYDWGWTHPSYHTEDRDTLAGLLAEKLGTTVQEQLDAAAKRARNRS